MFEEKILKSLRHLLTPNACVTDNFVYRLHYMATVVILMFSSIMVTARQYIGDPIECMSDQRHTKAYKGIPKDFLSTYCWINPTYSINTSWRKLVGQEVPYPGVDKSTSTDERVYHSYYQWVCFILAFQALLFYIPRYLWKSWEAGRFKKMLQGLNNPILNQGVKNTKRGLLVDYLYKNLGNNNTLFAVHVVTEGLNLLNVCLQIVLMDRFLGGQFTSYGWDVLWFSDWDEYVKYDPMLKVFPRLTKCTFHLYGPSGDVEKHNAYCILRINILNEKIYLFLWFWFYFLAIITSMALVYRAMTIFVPRVRSLSTRTRCLSTRDMLRSLCHKCQIGDWFVLDILSKNLDPLNFRDVIVDIHGLLDAKGDKLMNGF